MDNLMVNTDTIVLEKLQVIGQQFADMATLRSSLELESYTDFMLGGLVYRLRGYVLAEEVDNRSRDVVFEIAQPSNWWQHFKLDVFPAWLLKRIPVKYKTLRQKRRVTFRKLATYPKANMILPKEMGNRIVYRTQLREEDIEL